MQIYIDVFLLNLWDAQIFTPPYILLIIFLIHQKGMTLNHDFCYSFSLSSLLGGKRKGEKNNESRDFKSCLSDGSIFWNIEYISTFINFVFQRIKSGAAGHIWQKDASKKESQTELKKNQLLFKYKPKTIIYKLFWTTLLYDIDDFLWPNIIFLLYHIIVCISWKRKKFIYPEAFRLIKSRAGILHPSYYAPDRIQNTMFLPLMKKLS